MSIRKLLFETAIILVIITFIIVFINTYQVHNNIAKDLNYLQEQYLSATYDIYKNELIGDILVGNKNIEKSLLDDIRNSRDVGSILSYQGEKFESGKYASQKPLVTYTLNLGNNEFAHLALYPLRTLKVFNVFNELILPLSIEILVLLFGFVFILKRIRRKLLSPLNDLYENVKVGSIDSYRQSSDSVIELKQLCNTMKDMNKEVRTKAQYEAESLAAKQVAHDIRSPLACLNLLLSYADQLPEKQRILMRSSIQRITDIANTLQNKANKFEQINMTERVQCVLIATLIESVVTEKRMQLGLSANIHIDVNLDQSYGLFVLVDPIELKRVLSNLINNSLEAFSSDRQHHIVIAITHENNHVIITVEDDGCGIPNDILNKIGAYGYSYGKNTLTDSGNGLGLYHAINTVKTFSGELTIKSSLDVGTVVKLDFPRAKNPSWFVECLDLRKIKKIIILDDDKSIHNLWNDKLDAYSHRENFDVLHFTMSQDFRLFVENKDNVITDSTLFLLDYELVGQGVTGLELIKQYHLGKNAILVTSHQDDEDIKNTALSLKVGMIPKGIVHYLPLL